MYYLLLFTSPTVTYIGPFGDAEQARTLNQKMRRKGRVFQYVSRFPLLADRIVNPNEYKKGQTA
jgi:hypothetical protein